jgi:hypothetical protein
MNLINIYLEIIYVKIEIYIIQNKYILYKFYRNFI